MAERHIYGSDHKYKGSMDDDGRIYDAHHRFIGRVKNGTIYDDCNIPRGHINSDGRVTDMCNIPTGREFGANFEGWGGHGSGYVRNDVLGSGHGNDYGVFQQLDRHRHDSYSYDDDEDYDDDEGCGDEDEGSDWGDESFTPEPPPRRRRRRNDSGNSQSDIEEGIGGCVDGIGGCVGVIFGLILLYQVVKHFAS